ncbi:uncharacterized protein N7479_002949 [Penicillium vulpinum]|uniref:Uncharacterized protein n=1 Tax=Penicillium vulpinum TaxID=29845 RepID=A0A1V6REM4_9EURO|nr:uncharacterized protein N7479_002949 [Penicillium vulpinum]KAJ5973031.1 hypothetical protein N7479_002949 [Penicillium vulpinum]OQD99763.1 hypothetical protein PENVUL_c061G08391 [Penicillium vulpinum]
MSHSTRSIAGSDQTERFATNEETFVRGLAETVLKDSDSSQLALCDQSSSSNYSDLSQCSDFDTSDDSVIGYQYQNDEDDGTGVGVMEHTKPSIQKKDPGPSVRLRNANEFRAVMMSQIEDPAIPGLDNTGLPLLSHFTSSKDKEFRLLRPERTELDWKNGVRRSLLCLRTLRAAHGQLCGVEAPADQRCTACTNSKGPFEHCRIVFVRDRAEWSGACANCSFGVGIQNCSFRLQALLNVPWAVAPVPKNQPLINEGFIPTKSTGQKRPAAAAELDLQSSINRRIRDTFHGHRHSISNGTPVAPNTANKEQHVKRRKSEVALAKPSRSATKDAPPKLKNGGLPFNNTWYNSPLEDPEVYRMKHKAYVIDAYNDLAGIIARTTEDHGRMKAALVKKGFLLESDDESEENVFAMG